MNAAEQRQTGDRIAIPGDYQFSATWNGWAAQKFWHQTRFDESLKILQLGKTDVVLDVGCGSGVFAAKVAQAVSSCQVLGIDANTRAVHFAREKFSFPNLRFENCLADELEIPAGRITRISFLEVIEHLPYEQALSVLKLFHQILKPGGRLVISTPNKRSLYPIIESTLDRLKIVPQLEGEQHLMMYDVSTLSKIASEAGFKLVDSITINAFAPWLSPISWPLAQRVHRWEQQHHLGIGGLLLQAFEK